MSDLEHLRRSVSGTLDRARSRTDPARESLEEPGQVQVQVQVRGRGRGRGRNHDRSVDMDSTTSDLVRLEQATERQRQICAQQRQEVEGVQEERQHFQQEAKKARRQCRALEQELEFAVTAIQLVLRRRQDLEFRVAEQEEKLAAALRERKKVTVAVLETQDAMERISSKLGTLE